MTTSPDRKKKRIFLVDDHPLVREWLTNLINQQPDLAVCGESETAPQALQAIAHSKPDVAIVDLSLKDSSGIELIKDLKQSHPNVAVLVLSMHDEAHYAERALRAGARGYVMKRETTRKVIEAIRRILEGKLYVSERVTEAMTGRFVEGKRSGGAPAAIASTWCSANSWHECWHDSACSPSSIRALRDLWCAISAARRRRVSARLSRNA